MLAQEGEWLKHYPEYNHIPDRYVNKMLIDNKGNKWVGTNNGLAKFDGKNWIQYTPENSGLPDSISSTVPWVYSFAVDGNDNLWIATQELGIIFFDGNTWRRLDTTNSPINGNKILTIVSDKERGVWISSDDLKIINHQWVHKRGLDHFDGNNWRTFDLDTINIYGNDIRSMTVDYDNNLWIGSIAQIVKYDGNNWFYYEPKLDVRDAINVLKSDKDGNIWFSPKGEGILMFDGINFTEYSEYPGGTTLTSIDIDKTGNIWLGSYGGLVKYDGNNWELFNQDNSGILAKSVETLMVDSTGLVWAGTYVGISTYDGNKWDVIGASGGLPDNSVNVIVIDKNNVKWIGTRSYGLVKYDGIQWINYAAYNSDIPNSEITTLTIDRNDNLWIGTSDKGLVKYDGTNWTIYNENNSGLSANWIKDIEVDKDNEIWICAYKFDGGRNGYLINFDGNDWEIYNWENSILPREMLLTVTVDDSNNIWVGSLGYGLYKYNGTTWTNFNMNNSDLTSNVVESIIIDNYGNKWIGTSYGICMFDDIKWKCYTTQNSDIADNYIVSIAEDTLGNIWAGLYGYHGLSKFDRSKWVNYNTIVDTTFGGISPVAIAIDKYGNKWLGDTWQGVLVFNEDKIVDIKELPNIKLANTFKLYPNYPNPFNPSTTIKYSIPFSKDIRGVLNNVTLKVYNILGEEVTTLIDEAKLSGNYEITFDAGTFPSGVYFYKLKCNNFSKTNKMLLLK